MWGRNLRGCDEEVPGQQTSQTQNERDDGDSLTTVDTKRLQTSRSNLNKAHQKTSNSPVGGWNRPVPHLKILFLKTTK